MKYVLGVVYSLGLSLTHLKNIRGLILLKPPVSQFGVSTLTGTLLVAK
jgi:hypothetical protein